MCEDDNGDYDDDGKEPKCEVSNHVGDPRCKLATVARFTNLPVKDDHHDDDDEDPDDDDLMMMKTYGSGSLQSVSSKMAFNVPSQPDDDHDDNVVDDNDYNGEDYKNLRWSPFGRGG